MFSIHVIDDDPNNFDIIETLLRSKRGAASSKATVSLEETYSYQCHYSASGPDAIASLDTIQPDLILLDVVMPEMDGVEVCERIKAMPKWESVPIIMVTGLSTKNDLVECFAAGADDFISKPLNSLELQARVQSMLRIRQQYLQLAISNEELARSTRLKDEFLANMSHELRTPLNVILGMTEILLGRGYGDINQLQEKALQSVDRSAKHFLELINEILDLAKIEAGHIELEYGLTSISNLCHSSLSFVKQQALKKSIELDIKIENQLSEIHLDQRRIRQVLINLLTNAVKFTPEGGQVTFEVSGQSSIIDSGKVTAKKNQEFCRFSVIDTGIGIAPEKLDCLFQPFIQIDSALNRQYCGTGLGLALVKRIVELHGGYVQVESALNVGSCFHVYLPHQSRSRFECHGSDLSSEKEMIFSVAVAKNDHPVILLVDDNEANVITISDYLESHGYRLLIATNGEEAIALTKNQGPDLVLMDIQMPGVDGIQAIEEIRRDPEFSDLPIIALTALAMKGDRERCLQAGASDYLAKPTPLRELVKKIKKLLPPSKSSL